MSNNDPMDTSNNESQNEKPISNASQSQIAQKTWEISNFMQGLKKKKFILILIWSVGFRYEFILNKRNKFGGRVVQIRRDGASKFADGKTVGKRSSLF